MRCPTCTRSRQPDHLMCGPCWSLVPANTRKNVWRTARAMWTRPGDATAREAWQAARAEAIAWVEAGRPKGKVR